MDLPLLIHLRVATSVARALSCKSLDAILALDSAILLRTVSYSN